MSGVDILKNLPDHPAIDWSKIYTRENSEVLVIDVVCADCGKVRQYYIGSVVSNINRGNFTGKCKTCVNLGKNIEKLARLYPHPGVHWNCTKPVFLRGRFWNHVKLICVKCGKEQWQNATGVAQRIKEGGYTGKCFTCAKLPKPTNPKYLSTGRCLSHYGYVCLSADAISPEDLPLYRLIRERRNVAVFEHRWVMAKHLGRPLRDDELVDHLDGNKQNNELSNLRIYVKGKNQPGSHNGNGTYYHEWQSSLAKIAELKTALSELRNYMDT